MAIFGKKRGRPKGIPKHPMTLKEMFQRAMIQEFKANPELLRRVAAKEHGYLELLEEEDPVEKAKQGHILVAMNNDPAFQKQVREEYLRGGREPIAVEQEVKAAIDEFTLQQIKESPELRQILVARRIEQLSGKSNSNKGSNLKVALTELREARQLEEELGLNGEKKSGLGSLLTPDVIVTALTNLPTILQSLGGGNVQPKYFVDTPQGPRELSAAEYKAYTEQRQRQLPPGNQVAVSLSAAPQVTPFSPASAPVPLDPAPVPLNLSSWLPWLERDPEDFVSWLLTESVGESKEGKQAAFALKLLSNTTAEKFLAAVSPAKAKGGTVAEVITKLEAKPEWLGKSIALLAMEPPNVQEEIAPSGSV